MYHSERSVYVSLTALAALGRLEKKKKRGGASRASYDRRSRLYYMNMQFSSLSMHRLHRDTVEVVHYCLLVVYMYMYQGSKSIVVAKYNVHGNCKFVNDIYG